MPDNFNQKDSMLFVSVHMITFNHEKYIREAIDGVLMQQTDFKYELVISNDCSTDNSDSIIREYISNHIKGGSIRYFKHETNIGMMSNFIFALKECKGKYVAICEGDDFWTDSCKLQKQVDILEMNNNYSMVFTNRRVDSVDTGLTKVEYYEKKGGGNVFTATDIVAGFIPGAQTILFRNYSSLADYFSANPGFYYADRYVTYFCSLFGDLFLLSEITAVYRMTGTGAWTVNTPLEKLHRQNKFMFDFHKSLGIPVNNEVLAGFSFNSSLTTLLYCIKRPKFLFNRNYRKIILQPWSVYKKMNRVKMFFKAINKRRNSKKQDKNN